MDGQEESAVVEFLTLKYYIFLPHRKCYVGIGCSNTDDRMTAQAVNISLSIYALISLLATLINLAHAVFVFLKNPKSPVNLLWSLSVLCLVLWGCSEIIMRVTTDESTAVIANRIGGIGFRLLPSFFLHFTLAFTNRTVFVPQWKTYCMIYIPGIIFSIVQFRDLITEVAHLPWGFSSTPANGFLPFILWLEIYFFWGLYLCYQKFKRGQSNRVQKQALFIILGVTIPLLTSSLIDALLPLLGVQLFRVAEVSSTITVAFVTYAIVRFQLMSLTPETTATTILDTMGDLLVVTDATGIIVFINKAFRDVMSVPGDAKNPFHIGDFIEHDNNILEEARNAHRATTKSKIMEVEYKTLQGERFPVILSISPIDKDGESLGFVFFAHDITERKQLHHQLDEIARQRTEDLRMFATSVQRAEEEERRRIARELHDDLGQQLSGMRFNLEVFEETMPKTNRTTIKRLKYFKQHIDEIITEIRRISANLHPAALDNFGLLIALQLLCKDFEKVHRIPIRFLSDNAPMERYDPHVEIALYRIAQEALANIANHAGASAVTIQVLRGGSSICLTIEDDGKGFDVRKAHMRKGSDRGLGLISMKERSELLGGTCQIESSPSKGTKIHVEILISQ